LVPQLSDGPQVGEVWKIRNERQHKGEPRHAYARILGPGTTPGSYAVAVEGGPELSFRNTDQLLERRPRTGRVTSPVDASPSIPLSGQSTELVPPVSENGEDETVSGLVRCAQSPIEGAGGQAVVERPQASSMEIDQGMDGPLPANPPLSLKRSSRVPKPNPKYSVGSPQNSDSRSHPKRSKLL
jgi:hypothetical protein